MKFIDRAVGVLARWRAVVLVGLLIAAALVTPVQLLGRLAEDALRSDFAARNAAERLRTAQLGANLVHERLRGAGEQLAALSTRPSLRAALAAKDAAPLVRELALVRDAGRYDVVSAADPDGRQFARIPDLPPFDVTSRDYFRGALQSNSWIPSAAFVSAAPSQDVLVGVSYAVREDRRVVGVLFAGMTPERILESLQPIRTVSEREILVVDQRRVLVASSNPDRVLLSVVDLPVPAPGTDSGTAVAPRDRLATFVSVPQVGWALYLVDDPAVVLAPEERLSQQIVLATLTATTLALIIAALIAFLYAMVAVSNRRVLEATQRVALTDPLTRLYNRRFMDEQLQLLVSLAARHGQTFSVLMLDVDGLKRVNDTYGHERGDRVLQLVAAAIRETLRASDVPIRIGGDEFVALLPNTGLDEAFGVAERIRQAVRQHVASDPGGSVDVSLGVAGWRAGASVADLLKDADEGLYAAKRAGKGRIARRPASSRA